MTRNYSLTLLFALFVLPLGACSTTGHGTAGGDAVTAQDASTVLFADDFTDNWQDNWFLDGKLATVRNSDDGLYFSAGTVTKAMDPVAYHAHHAVLWTRQVFEGDIRITYEMTREDVDGSGTTLLYVMAQGIDTPPYVEDIYRWRELREIPSMDLYFKRMDLLSLSFRENLRCKRYPWYNAADELYPGGGLIEPMADYEQIQPGKRYRVEVEKRASSLSLKLIDLDDEEVLLDHTWDTDQINEDIEPQQIRKGRIGLRHMATRQFTYHSFTVEQLPAETTSSSSMR